MRELQDAMKLWPLLVVAANVLLGWLFWSAKKHFASREGLTELNHRLDCRAEALSLKCERLGDGTDKRLDALEKDVAVVQSRLEAMPTQESVHRLEVAIGRVEGDLQGLAAGLEATTKGIERNLHLLLKCQLEPE